MRPSSTASSRGPGPTTARRPRPRCGRASPNPDTICATRAAEISAPVLITWGARDLTAPARWGKAVQAAIPGSTFEALPAGHVVFSSEPEAWLQSVLPFVDAAHGVRAERR